MFNLSVPIQSILPVFLIHVKFGTGYLDGKGVLKLIWVQGVLLVVEIAKVLSQLNPRPMTSI